ncbi:hypothetical protein [Petropleomorpha daqingensis]|uniref:Uncharacterized protein n=1 Tax=Petropleomorpha daqingensis TaxID=2026353 RepID=A0A853CCS5_9ACTN|nr:hypothetical protein [Petropleomorpha daqingensis]NYJ04941.1 hypothetical protein [Petropleomorpha daqingensis]
MRLLTVRLVAFLWALTWWIFPGFGLIDLSVTWDPGWPVVLEASWGVFMTVLVGGSFLVVAVRPRRTAPALLTLGIALAALLVCAAAGLEPQVLGYAGVLAVQTAVLLALLRPWREPLRPVLGRPSLPLLVAAVAGAVPWLVHAGAVFADNRRDAGESIGDRTNGVDHYAVQGALALALIALPSLAAVWPRGRRHLGVSAGLSAAYLGLVSVAFPDTWAGFSPTWSVLCLAWGFAVAVLALVPPRLQLGELRGEVVEAERAL